MCSFKVEQLTWLLNVAGLGVLVQMFKLACVNITQTALNI